MDKDYVKNYIKIIKYGMIYYKNTEKNKTVNKCG